MKTHCASLLLGGRSLALFFISGGNQTWSKGFGVELSNQLHQWNVTAVCAILIIYASLEIIDQIQCMQKETTQEDIV